MACLENAKTEGSGFITEAFDVPLEKSIEETHRGKRDMIRGIVDLSKQPFGRLWFRG